MNNEDLHKNSAHSQFKFTNYWSDVTVQNQVSEGATLRQQKLKQKTYQNTINLNYDEPSTSKSNQMHQVFRKPVSNKPRKTKGRNYPRRCPIRIAELAVPSKRQCIDTWRTKASVIPNFMVERLKQRVLDEKPIVLIADAVNCFKRTKIKPRKRTLKNPYSKSENTRKREFKVLCAIFGYKIALKLRRPMNLSLNSGLDKINNIIKGEIDAMLRYKNNSRQKVVRNKELLEEISRKITVWIDTILEESDCKLLEENLQELEQEEGPVLDLIDDLVEEVLIICKPPTLVKSSEKSSENDLLPDLSEDKSIEKSIANSEVNINQLMTDFYTDALEDAERQILEKHDDYLLSAETSSIQQHIDLSIHADSEHMVENVRKELNELVYQIITDLIPAVSQFQDEKYIEINEDAKQKSNQELTTPSSEFEENNNDPLQNPEALLVQENNINLKEDPNSTEQSKTLNVSLEYKEDASITNDLKNETNENTEIVKEIINDFLISSVLNSEPNVLMIDNDNITQAADIEFILKQGTLQTEKKLNNVTEDSRNELLVKVDETEQVKTDNITQFDDIENKDFSLSPKSNETKQIAQDVLITIFDNLAVESFYDENEAIEDNKKVKFSAIDMGIKESGVNKKLLTKLSGQELISQTPSTDYLKLNIDFAPPNENLLSNADESWPQNIALPILKVTESVNKSVTSLGKIFEIDEKGISSESSYVSIENSEMLIDVQLTSISMDNSKMNDMLLAPFQNENEIVVGREKINKIENKKTQPTITNKKKQVKNKKNDKSEIKQGLKLRDVNQNKSKTPSEKILNKSTNVNQKLDKKFIKTYNKDEKPIKNKRMLHIDKISNKTDGKKVSNNKKDVAKNKIHENRTVIKQKKLITPEIDVKKAEKITGPLDVISKEDRGDGIKNEQKHEAYSCEKIVPTVQKTKLKQNGKIKIDAYDVLKWCKGLENVIENLETWNAWMNSTCKCITLLKQKGNNNSLKSVERARRKWKMLHKNIIQDRILWRDMKQRNRDGLKSYKKYYHDIKNGATKFQMCDCGNN